MELAVNIIIKVALIMMKCMYDWFFDVRSGMDDYYIQLISYKMYLYIYHLSIDLSIYLSNHRFPPE